MSSSHWRDACFHESSDSASGLTACTSTVEAAAAKPHRDGTSAAICSSGNRPDNGNSAPAKSSEIKTISTPVNSTCSEYAASAEKARATIAETMATTAST